MGETVFRACDITKTYTKHKRSHTVLKGLNMEIRRGEIYGFVGANGAGKTTLIRILAGFIRQTDGRLELFGEDAPDKLYIQRARINGIIESPAIYPHMTAADNLEVCRRQLGIRGDQCIREALETVGLGDVGDKKAKNFSLGMKQRLSIAMALLGKPELLFLDEPINGLDPEGMADLRELLGKLNREMGITMLISSHMLSELHQLATCYGFIHNGKMIEQITAEELSRKCRKYLSVKVDRTAEAETVLRTKFLLQDLKAVSDDTIRVYDLPDKLETGEVNKALVLAGINVEAVAIQEMKVEDYYFSLIGRQKKYQHTEKGA